MGAPGFSPAHATFTSIAIDSAGTPYVGFVDQANANKASVMKYNGTGWVNVGSPGFSPAGLTSPHDVHIAIGSGGMPYIAFEDSTHGYKVTVMRYDGGSWITVGAPGFSGSAVNELSFAIDHAGTPYVAYPDVTGLSGMGNGVTVMKYNGSVWTAVGVVEFTHGSSGFTAGFISLAIDTAGKPYVAYSNGTLSGTFKAAAMKYNGTNWVYVGAPNFSAGEADFVSIAISQGGTPYVVYRDLTVSGKATMMKYNGTSWVAVGPVGFTAHDAQQTQVVFDKDGTPYVSFLDDVGATTPASVMKYNGSSWVIAGTADFSAGMVNDMTMAIDGSGTPFVAYTDYANSLKATVMRLGTLPPPITGSNVLCVGTAITLNDMAAGGAWSSSNTAVATITPGGVVTGVAAGTSVISYTTAGGTTTFNITVNGGPSVSSITGAATVCPGAAITLGDATSGGTWSSGSTGIATVSSTGIVNGVSAGTANISYTVTNGCGSTAAFVTVTVNSLPSAGTITGATTVCAGSVTTLSDATATGAGTWSSSSTGTATVDASGVVSGIMPGTSVISYTVTNSCGSASASLTITVNPLPSAGSITGTTTLCTGTTATLSDGTASSAGIWSSSNAAVVTVTSSGVISGIMPGTATIFYTVSNSCGTDIASVVITVSTSATAGTISGTMTVCAGSTVTLSDGVAGGAWSSGATGIATVTASGVVSGISAGTAHISYTVTSACGTATTFSTVTVNPLPSAGSISGASAICAGATATLTDGVTGGTWSSGSPGVVTVSASGMIAGINAGIASIYYTVTNSCGSATATTAITVDVAPASAVITGTDSVCLHDTVMLSGTPAGGAWSSSNPSVTQVIAGYVVGLSLGMDTIRYTLTNSCGSNTARLVFTVGSYAMCGSGVSVQVVNAGGGMSVQPNPSDGTFVLKLSSSAVDKDMQVTITNITGEKVGAFTGKTNEPLDVKLNVHAGIYLLFTTSGNERYFEKIIVH